MMSEYNKELESNTLAKSAFTTCTLYDYDKSPLPYTGIKGIDYENDGPDLKQHCAYLMEKKIWNRFNRRNDKNQLLPVSSEEFPIDISFMIEGPKELLHLGLFICTADAIRSDKDNVLKVLPVLPDDEDNDHPPLHPATTKSRRRPVKLPRKPKSPPAVKDDKLYAHPLPNTQTCKRLGTALQLSPVPHVIRDLNLPALLLRAQVCQNYELAHGDRLSWSKLDTQSKKSDLFFQAILLRTTGWVKRFWDTWYKQENQSKGNIIPSINDFPIFQIFLE